MFKNEGTSFAQQHNQLESQVSGVSRGSAQQQAADGTKLMMMVGCNSPISKGEGAKSPEIGRTKCPARVYLHAYPFTIVTNQCRPIFEPCLRSHKPGGYAGWCEVRNENWYMADLPNPLVDSILILKYNGNTLRSSKPFEY